MPLTKGNGVRIHYELRGQGEPLVLIMGLGADGSLWEEHVRAYEPHFQCILIDNRGAGRSDKPQGPYTTAEMAGDALRVMDELGVNKAHVSGISMGGAIAQQMALTAPERIRTLTLISSWHYCDAYTVRIFETLKAVIGAVDPVAFTRLLQLLIFAPVYHESRLDDLLQRERQGLGNPHPMPEHAFRAQSDACIGHHTKGLLERIAAPTLITVGDKDIFTPLHYSAAMAKQIPDTRLVVFEGGGHTHHWEQLERFNRITLEFLTAHREQRRGSD